MTEGEVNPNAKFEALKKDLREKRDRDLRLDQYYLCEHDGDTWYSGKDFRIRAAKIDSELKKSEAQIENEINLQAINKVFSQTLERPKDIAGEITIFVNDSEASIPTPTELH